jgi:hypothetical protein
LQYVSPSLEIIVPDEIPHHLLISAHEPCDQRHEGGAVEFINNPVMRLASTSHTRAIYQEVSGTFGLKTGECRNIACTSQTVLDPCVGR